MRLSRNNGHTTMRVVAAVILLAVAVKTILILNYYWGKRRKLNAVSIPEALHALTHAVDAERRALAARALCSILFGEVAVLEELVDEVHGRHPEFSTPRSDGRNLLDIAIADMLRGSQDAAMLLLACTEPDEQWDDDDEWNKLTVDTARLLRNSPGVLSAFEQAKTASGSVLLARMRGGKAATPRGFSLHDARHPPLVDIPDVVPFNTRVNCAECGKCLPFVDGRPLHLRCVACNNVGYCCEEHARKDASRHEFWCASSLFPALSMTSGRVPQS